jgi:hypothetical protein
MQSRCKTRTIAIICFSTNWICATSAFAYNLPGNRAAYLIHLFGIDLFYFDFDLSCMTICFILISVFVSVVAA